jgi:integrase/recombinase XerD
MIQRIINELCLLIIVIDLQKQRQKKKLQLTSVIMNKTNDTIMMEYFEAMQTEINPSTNYVKTNQNTLDKLLDFHNNKLLTEITREDIISYLNSLKKSDEIDPLHKWIGTYNSRLRNLLRFFKWLYSPTLAHNQRPKPKLLLNVSQLRRKETSIYKPTDLWTLEDDLVFLKWCPNKRDRCYHAISRDLSARPHEILNLKIKDVVYRQIDNKQYAEVLVNGKTGTRHLPLIDSIPYVKEWLDEHPQRSNRNAYLICTMIRRNVGGRLSRDSLFHIYARDYKQNYFPMLLRNPMISNEDKQKIRDILRKPWNLYIRRHSSLTQKSKFLKEHILRQHAGWSPRSQMHLKYLHYFGNESSESILQEYGILPKDNQETDLLRSKQCPNCNEPNRPDQKFCVKCKMVLTYDAYSETIEEKQIKDKQIEEMMRKQEQFEQLIQSLIDSGQLKSN